MGFQQRTSGSWIRIQKVLAWVETPHRGQYHIPVDWNPIAGSELHFVVDSRVEYKHITALVHSRDKDALNHAQIDVMDFIGGAA